MLSNDQKQELNKKLDPKNVKHRTQFDLTLSYIEGWHAIAEANRIFGFDGWVRETLDLIENHPPTKNHKGNFVVSFRACVRITAGGVSRDGVGHGSGVSSNLSDAYEGATKEAETDAMKRAFMTFGNPFGLALYDKKQENVGVDELTEQEKRANALKWATNQKTYLSGIVNESDLTNWTIENDSAFKALKERYPEYYAEVNMELMNKMDELLPMAAE